MPTTSLNFDLPVKYQAIGNSTVKFPLVTIALLPVTSTGRKFQTAALVDSGANLPVFPEDHAHQIGIPDITTGPQRDLVGLGTGVGWDHNIKLEVFGVTISALVAFTKAKLPFPLLGREGFFVHFKLCFRQSKALIHVALTP